MHRLTLLTTCTVVEVIFGVRKSSYARGDLIVVQLQLGQHRPLREFLHQEDQLHEKQEEWMMVIESRGRKTKESEAKTHLLVSHTTPAKAQLGLFVCRGCGIDALGELGEDLWGQPKTRRSALRHPVVSYSAHAKPARIEAYGSIKARDTYHTWKTPRRGRTPR
jgi:hypothetical protein